MLKNAPTLAIVAVHTAENEPLKISLVHVIRSILSLARTQIHFYERPVLGCIDSYDSESRRIFQDFSRSTRFILPRWGGKKQRVFYSPKKIFWQVCETRGEELELLRGPIPTCNLENL